MRFQSSEPTATGPGEVYEIEMEYKKHRAADMNIAVSAIKDAETYLSECFIQSSFESMKSSGHYISSCDNVDRSGWCVKFTVHQDSISDNYTAHALFRRNIDTDANAGNVLKERQIERHVEEASKQSRTAIRDDVYVAVTTNVFNRLAKKLGVRPYPVDLRALNDAVRLDMSSKCVLMLIDPSEYDKAIVDTLVQCCGIRVAFVSPGEIGSHKLNELKALIDLMVKLHDDRISKEKQIASEREDEYRARHRSILDTEIFGPYHVDNLTLVEAVESLFLRINGDLRPYDFALGMGLGTEGAREDFRYNFQIPRMHVVEILSYAAAQLNCTVTNQNGFISFTYKANSKEDQRDGK